MVMTTKQVRGLILSAASLAADIAGATEEEAKRSLDAIEKEFNAWLITRGNRISKRRPNFDGNYTYVGVGDVIELVGDYWKNHGNPSVYQGSHQTVIGFDADDDPKFTYTDRNGDDHISVAYGVGPQSYGWRLVMAAEEEDE